MMAGSQARTRIFLLFIPLLYLIPGINSHYDIILKDFPTHVFQRHLKVSRHNPFCVVFRETGSGSKLEKSIHEIWKKAPNAAANYTRWELAAVNGDQAKLPPKETKPDKLPSVRCYLGETSKYDYRGKTSKGSLRNWLTQLDSLHEEQSQEVTPGLLEEVMSRFHIVLLAFPDGPRHHQVEDMMYELAASIDSCKALAIHLNSPDVLSLRERFGVKTYPSVVVIHIDRTVVNGTNLTVSDHRVFAGLACESRALRLYVRAKAMDIPLLNLDSFDTLLSTKTGSSFRLTPVLVCFYDHHHNDAFSYLEAFNWTATQYKEDGVNLRYGLVDITQGFMSKLVPRYMRGVTMRRIPFLSLFYKGEDGSIKHTEMYTDWPYPWVLYRPLVDIGHGLSDTLGLTEYVAPWGVATLDLFSSMYEGPNGTLCTLWSHNQTDNTPPPRKVKVKIFKVIKKAASPVSKEKQWHDMFDTDKLEKKLSTHESIPLLTQETWPDIVEKSHAPRHIFYSVGKWAGEVTKVSLVVFIMADCGNCRRKNDTFREIQKAVSHIDGGAMYYVNCTTEKLLCRNLNIRGYPTIAGYRGLGWMGTSSCLTPHSQEMFRKYVRVDFHGPIMTASVMEWFSRVADNAVKNIKHGKVPRNFETKDVRIIATVLPRTATAPSSSNDTSSTVAEFSYKCLRLMCERLFGLLDCYTLYSPRLAEAAYTADDVELYVTKLPFERADGLQTTMMERGKSLHETLEGDSSSDVHKFHVPHSYDLDPSMTCEADPATCTDVMVEFILGHSRMPVTALTSDILHTASSSLKEETLPILVALSLPEHIKTSAEFYKTLTAVAYKFYSQIVVMTLDAKYYSVYATSFVPLKYGKLRAFESKDHDPYHMYQYPRLCIVRREDHTHAALYPPVKAPRTSGDFTEAAITEFVQAYLDDPSSLIIETEKF